MVINNVVCFDRISKTAPGEWMEVVGGGGVVWGVLEDETSSAQSIP